MPKLLFLVTEDWYFVSHRLALARQAKAQGYEVVVATRIREHAQPILEAGIRLVPLEMSRRSTSVRSLLQEILRVRRLYQSERPDIVHHVALKPVIVGGLAARTLRLRKVVSAVAGMGFLFTEQGRASRTRKVLEWVFPKAIGSGLAIVQNSEDQQALIGMGVAKSQTRLIAGAGVNLKHFVVTPEPEGVPIIMMASRLLWDKGVGEFVAASRLVRQHGLQPRFVLVGDPDPDNPAGIDQQVLDQWVRDGDVEWWGHSDDMASTLSQSTIVCLPSYREGLPKVLLEAMASGRACITTDVPGCRDTVSDGDNGLLVPVKDSVALANAMVQLLNDAQTRQRMARRGRQRAEQEFSQERINGATLAVYRELCT